MADAKIYCGDRSDLPGGQGYSRFGTRNECLKCGFGAAMYKYRWEPADDQPRPPPRAQQGCLRPRRHDRGAVRGNQFVDQPRGARPPPPPPRLSPSFPPEDPPHDLDLPRPQDRGVRSSTKRIIAIAVWVVACIVAFVLLYKFPPNAITKIEDKKKVIKWDKFAGVYTLIITGIAAVTALIYSMIRSHGA